MVDRIGQSGGLARAAIEAALKTQAEALARLSREQESQATSVEGPARASNFARALGDGLREVDAQVQRADELAQDVVTGKITDFHEVAAQLKQSELSLKFALEVRNKFIDAYREIMRMSV